MNAREAKEKLAQIRFKWQTGQITKEEMYQEAEEPLRVYNAKATEIAKKYGVRAKCLPRNVIFW